MKLWITYWRKKMTLHEYKNLTQSELEMADHYAEIGDASALRRYQKLSADRENKDTNPNTYALPLQPIEI